MPNSFKNLYYSAAVLGFGILAVGVHKCNKEVVSIIQDYKAQARIDSLQKAIQPDFKAIDSVGFAALDPAYAEKFQEFKKQGREINDNLRNEVIGLTAHVMEEPMKQQLAVAAEKHPDILFKLEKRQIVEDDVLCEYLSLTATRKADQTELDRNDYYKIPVKTADLKL